MESSGRLDSLSEYAVPVPEDEITPFLTQHYRQNCPAELITKPLPGAAVMVLLSASNGFPVTINTGEGQPACELLHAAQANHTHRTASSQ